jgi:flavin reductase (DIM6/NTAB) family NADH-FMN oxidoreductase RutF
LSANRVRYDPFRPVYPSPAALITSIDSEGRPNIITLGECFNLSIREPVIVGIAIAPERYSHGLISAQKEFVVNLPPASLLPKVLKPPLIAECPVNIECKLLFVQTIGDHDLFAGEVLAHHVDPDVLGENGRFDPAKLTTIVLAGGHFLSLGEHLQGWR